MRKALIIVDMQKAFINEYTEDLVDKIREYARQNDFNAIACTAYVNNRDTACYKFEGWKQCMPGEMGTQVIDKLENISIKTFEKDKYSCWNSEFKTWVAENEFDVLYFVGVNTGCCVLHSAFDAYNDVQDIRVVGDLCGSTSGYESHERALEVLRECITKERVIKSELK